MAKKTGTTSTNMDHNHTYTIDKYGNGETSFDADHSHTITEHKVETTDHTHTIPNPNKRFRDLIKDK